MYSRVVVAIDGSPIAEAVLPYARGLAAALRVPLGLVRGVDGNEDRAEAEAYVVALAGRLAAEGRVVAAPGGVVEALLGELRRDPGTLLVMGTHARGVVAERVLGSVAMDVVRRSGRPVLVVRPPEGVPPAADQPSPAVTAVTVPLDGSAMSEAILPHAAALAKAADVPLLLLHVVPPAPQPAGAAAPPDVEALQTRTVATAQAAGAQVSWSVLRGDPAEAITDYVRRHPGALLAMATRGRSGLERSLLGSVAAECVRAAGAPVLLYRPQG